MTHAVCRRLHQLVAGIDQDDHRDHQDQQYQQEQLDQHAITNTRTLIVDKIFKLNKKYIYKSRFGLPFNPQGIFFSLLISIYLSIWDLSIFLSVVRLTLQSTYIYILFFYLGLDCQSIFRGWYFSHKRNKQKNSGMIII